MNIGKVRGIAIRMDRSAFLLIAILVVFFARYLPFISGAVAALLCVLSFLLHELGHAAVALRNGLPVRSINFFVFGGFTDLGERPRSPAQELKIALAGPAVSALLGALLIAISPWLGTHGYVAGRVNILITALNLLPIFPLDGGRALRAVFWKATGNYDKGTQQAYAFGRVIAYAVIVLGVVLIVSSMPIPGLVVILIGWRLKDLLRQDFVRASSIGFRHDRPHVV